MRHSDRVPSAPARAILFLSSFAPLFIVLAIRAVARDTIALAVAGCLVAISVGSVSVLTVWLRKAARFGPRPTTIVRTSPRDDLAVAYIVTYVVPFLGIDFSKFRDALALLLIFATTLTVAIRTNLFYVNPFLNLLGYHIYEAEDDKGQVFALISKSKSIRPGAQVPTVSLDKGSYVRLERI